MVCEFNSEAKMFKIRLLTSKVQVCTCLEFEESPARVRCLNGFGTGMRC